MNKWMTLGAMVAVSVGLSAALVLGGDRMGVMHGEERASAASGNAGLPWDITELPPGASRLWGQNGLVLSGDLGKASTLADLQRLWPIEVQMAIVAAPGEDGALEAFVDPAQLGFVAGKLVVSATLDARTIAGMRVRSSKVEFMDSTTRRFTLANSDVATALQAPISSVSLIPQAQLDAATVVQRFGQPSKRITRGEGDVAVEHLLYPAKGLDVVLSAKGKELLQYVAPAQFERLSQPLQAASSAP
jgi:hypothetical protein